MEINEFSIIMLMCVYFYARISDSMYCIFLFFSTPLCYFYFLHIIVHLFVLFLLFAHNCANKYKIDNISASLSLKSIHFFALFSYFYFLHIIVHTFVLFLLFAHSCAKLCSIINDISENIDIPYQTRYTVQDQYLRWKKKYPTMN